MRVCVKVCVCVHVSWLKGGVAIGVACYKKVHNIQIDSQTCTRLSAKVGYVKFIKSQFILF